MQNTHIFHSVFLHYIYPKYHGHPQKYNLENILITSTSETYGSAKYVPIDEEHPLIGQSPYSASKIAADQLAISYSKSKLASAYCYLNISAAYQMLQQYEKALNAYQLALALGKGNKDFENALKKCDVMAAPVTPYPAFKLGEKLEDPLQMYLADIFTIAANLAGICGISTPCGFITGENENKLPVGLQLLGPALQESTILKISDAFEKATQWHKERP